MGDLVPLHRIEGIPEEMGDSALVSAMAARDSAALGAFYDRFHRHVYRFVARLAGMDAPLDDLVQNTFLAAYHSARKFKARSQVRTWLFGIAANHVRDHVRKETRHRNALDRVAATPVTRGPNPAQLTEHAELLERLGPAIDALPMALKEAYVLFAVEELPGKEVARVLGIRESSLWRRLHDARKRIRQQLDGGLP